MLKELSASDWIAIFSLIVAAISFLVARKTLVDAEEFWKQQKWFDLYELAARASDNLEQYQVNYKALEGLLTTQQIQDWNNLMISMRTVGNLALVFPMCSVIDKLTKAVSDFKYPKNAVDPTRLAALNAAAEDLRHMALVDPSILKRRKLAKKWYSAFW